MQILSFFCQILMKPEFARQIFEKYSNIKFHENLSSASRVPYVRAGGREIVIAFCSFANAPERRLQYSVW